MYQHEPQSFPNSQLKKAVEIRQSLGMRRPDGPTPDLVLEELNDEDALDGLFYGNNKNKKLDKYLNSDFEMIAETSL